MKARSGKAARTAAAVVLGIGVASAAGSACNSAQDEYGAPVDDGDTMVSDGGAGGESTEGGGGAGAGSN